MVWGQTHIHFCSTGGTYGSSTDFGLENTGKNTLMDIIYRFII